MIAGPCHTTWAAGREILSGTSSAVSARAARICSRPTPPIQQGARVRHSDKHSTCDVRGQATLMCDYLLSTSLAGSEQPDGPSRAGCNGSVQQPSAAWNGSRHLGIQAVDMGVVAAAVRAAGGPHPQAAQAHHAARRPRRRLHPPPVSWSAPTQARHPGWSPPHQRRSVPLVALSAVPHLCSLQPEP